MTKVKRTVGKIYGREVCPEVETRMEEPSPTTTEQYRGCGERERGEDTGIEGEVRGRTAIHDPLQDGLLQRHVGEVLSEGGGIP
jgi:hypothetical protein